MMIKYKLEKGFGRCLEDYKRLSITDNDALIITFDIPTAYKISDTFVASIEIGEFKRNVSVIQKDKRNSRTVYFEIPKELTVPGVLKITVGNMVNGEPIKSWILESLILQDITLDNKKIIDIVPEIAELKQDIELLRKAIIELYEEKNKKGELL